MWDIILNGLFLTFGIFVGKAQGINYDITNQTKYMQELIDLAYAERDSARKLLAESQEKAESWERRYYNLLEEFYSTEEDEEVGS